MAFLYPWGNTQQLNLDWILQKIKELEIEGGGADLDEVANALISATYARQAYDRSDIVFYDGKLYRANQAIPAPGEVWTPAHWDEILLGDTVSNLVQYVAALSNDQIANSSSVTGTHTSDALDTLKTAIDNLAFTTDEIGNDSTVTGATLTAALETLKTDLSRKILYFKNVVVNQGISSQIIRIPESGTDPRLNDESIVIACEITNPENITTDLSWTTYAAGTVGFIGTCTEQTTANIIIATKAESEG